ncbi:MAG TPA: carbohydrate kinase family protein [Syntrophomonadaceae bacterium]|nr:carbohydrate kinase family protein [Syntrophomonadaceae bacterium]
MYTELHRNNEILLVAPAGYETAIQVDNLQKDYNATSNVYYQGGGHGGNLAYYLSNLGVRCALYTHWGDDLPGIKARETMLKAGVDISLCRTFEGETSQSNFLINIGSSKKTIMNFGTALGREDSEIKDIPIPKLFYTSLLPVKPALNLMKNANQIGAEVVVGFQIPTSVTESLGLTHAIIEQALACAAHVIGSYTVIAEEFNTNLKAAELVRWLKCEFPHLKTVVITAGENGSYAYANGEFFYQPAISIEEVDSTGAGDQFIAGFLKDYLLDGIALEITLKRAAFYSAIVCSREGSRVLVTDDEIEKLLCSKEVLDR